MWPFLWETGNILHDGQLLCWRWAPGAFKRGKVAKKLHISLSLSLYKYSILCGVCCRAPLLPLPFSLLSATYTHGHIPYAVRYVRISLSRSISSLSYRDPSADFLISRNMEKLGYRRRDPEPSSRKKPRLLAVEKEDEEDVFETLPDEILHHIFSFLPDLKDRRSCAAVSRRWLQLESLMRISDFSPPSTSSSFICSIDGEVKTVKNNAQLALLSIGSSGGTLDELVIRADVFLPPRSSLLSITNMGLIGISHACSQLKKLTLLDCHEVDRDGLSAIATASPNLVHLHISSCPLVDDDGLISFAMNCPKLSSLSLDRCPMITDRTLQAFSSFCPDLESLSLSRCPLITVFFLPKLSKLAISSSSSLTDQSLSLLCDTASRLETLKLEKCHGVTTRGLFLALEKLSASLKSLSLIKCDGIGEKTTPVFAKCFLMRSLEIKNCTKVQDELLFLMAGVMPLLRRITLSSMDQITDKGFLSILGSLQRRNMLCSVDLSKCRRITDRSVAALASSAGSSLLSLSLEGCENVTDGSLTFLALLCSRLVDLDLTNCRRISDSGVAALTRKKKLEMLSLEGCEGITDETLTRLEEMADEGNLVSLNLKKCQGLTRAGVDSIHHHLWWCDLIC